MRTLVRILVSLLALVLSGVRAPGGGGRSIDGAWQTVSFSVPLTTVEVVGVAADGTEYKIAPLEGLGYLWWPAERGSMVLTAFDADGNPVDSMNTGSDVCRALNNC